MRVRIGSRKSQLASWQANWVADRLRALGAEIEMVWLTTSGDTHVGSLATGGGQGLFTKEIQLALLEERCDLAVHSLKDLPTKTTPGLLLAAVPPRASVRDVLLSNSSASLADLPHQATIGTGSPRRTAQLKLLRPDLQTREIRGNLDTRLRKLDDGEFDAILLAEAGLARLGLSNRITERLTLEHMLPAAGQGALGLEIRAAHRELLAFLRPLDHPATRAAVTAERALLRALDAGCLAPIGVAAQVSEDRLDLQAIVARLDGSQALRTSVSGTPLHAEQVGRQAADNLRLGGYASYEIR